MGYALRRVAVTEWNGEDDVSHAICSESEQGWEAIIGFYGEEDMRAFYDVLHAYFTNGKIESDLVESEEIEGNWKQMWQAVRMAREFGAPASRSDDQIANTIRDAARKGRIKNAHQSVDGSDWWFSVRGLESYLDGVRWRDPKPVPASKYPTIIIDPATPMGASGRTMLEYMEDGNDNIVYQYNGVWYACHLDDGKIIGVVDEEHYKYLNQPVPAIATGKPIEKPEDRKAQNAILKQYGYRWENYTEEWLEDNDEFNREPGWYLFHSTGGATRELGRGSEAVGRAFDEINRGVDVVEAEERERQAQAQERRRVAKQRKVDLATLRDLISKNGQRADNAPGNMVLDNRTHHVGAGYTGWAIYRESELATLMDVTWEEPQYWRIDWAAIASEVERLGPGRIEVPLVIE